MFTPGNVDDPEPIYSESFIENVKGKLCGDKGYIGKQLFEFLFLRCATKALRDDEPGGSHPSLNAKKQPWGLLFAEREGFEPPEV